MAVSRPRRAASCPGLAMFTLRLLGSASLDGPDGPVAGRAALRQRIALLALLAVEHPRPLSRDKSGRLRSGPRAAPTRPGTCFATRSTSFARPWATTRCSSTGDDLRLNPDRLTCDLWEFEAALAREDPEAAVSRLPRPFLSGFHLSDAEEFERWADGERSRLARRYSPGARAAGGAGDSGWRPVACGGVVVATRQGGSLQLPDRAALHAGARGRRATGRGRSGTRASIPICCAPTSMLRRNARWSPWRRGSGSSRAPPQVVGGRPTTSGVSVSARRSRAAEHLLAALSLPGTADTPRLGRYRRWSRRRHGGAGSA